jgi:hypothetical protein
MADNDNVVAFIDTLTQVLVARKEWLEKEELPKLKDELRNYHTSFASLYNIYLKKKLIDEDPYKQDNKISELEIPDSSAFNEAKKREQLSIRLSNFDNQLDFLVNFYQLNIDFLNLDRLKRIVGLVRYIDWLSLTPDNPSVITKAVAEVSISSKSGVDAITLSIISESLSRLNKSTTATVGIVKNLNVYYREAYKLGIRQNITKSMAPNEATAENIRKKLPSAIPGSPFYKELVDEVLKEDYSSSGSDLRDAVLNTLKVKSEKPKAAKPAVNFKNILLDGIQIIGGSSNSLNEILVKLEENQAVIESRKKGFLETIKELIRQITHAAPEEVIYTIEHMDATKGIPVKEKLNYHQFIEELGKKSRILASFVRGPAYQKMSAMTEEQIIGYLDRNIKEMQNYHKTLSALDEFFKKHVVEEDRSKIKGIKPELSALKNSYVKANQMRYDYTAQKEEEEQLKRLGVSPDLAAAAMAEEAKSTPAPSAVPPGPPPAPKPQGAPAPHK